MNIIYFQINIILMQPERLDDDVICPDDARQARDQLGAKGGGVVGELHPVTLAALEDLQSEAVMPGVGDQDAVTLPEAQVVAHLVGAGAQDNGDHMQVLAGIHFSGREDVGWGGNPNWGDFETRDG